LRDFVIGAAAMSDLKSWISAIRERLQSFPGAGRRLAPRRLRGLRSGPGRFRGDERGVVAIYVGLSLPVLIGGMGLGAETGYWYWLQRELQHATDLATHAAATRRLYGASVEEQKAAALDIAKASGPSRLTLSDVTLNSPPATGNYQVPAPYWAMEGIVQYQVPRLFSSIFSDTPVTIRGRSVVVSQANGTACVLGLNKTKQGTVVVAGSAAVNINGCWVAANSSADDATDFTGANGAMAAYCVRAVGTVDEGATSQKKGIESTQLTTVCSAPLEYAPQLEDPYAGRTPPTHPGTCPGGNGQVSGGVTLHCSNWTPPTGVTGIHVFRNGANLVVNSNDTIASGAAGVTFYFEGTSSPQINGNARLNLSAPSADSDPTKGMLFWAASGNTQTMQINGNSSSTFEGAVYSPSGKIEWSGNGGEQGCVQLVADTISFTGNASTGISCGSAGTPDGATAIPTVLKVTLVE
jgi:Flp pilus assembly protein TadG